MVGAGTVFLLFLGPVCLMVIPLSLSLYLFDVLAPVLLLGYVFDDAMNGSGGGKNWGVLNILENLASNDPESPECS